MPKALENAHTDREDIELESIALIQNTLAQRLAQQKIGEPNTVVTKAQASQHFTCSA